MASNQGAGKSSHGCLKGGAIGLVAVLFLWKMISPADYEETVDELSGRQTEALRSPLKTQRLAGTWKIESSSSKREFRLYPDTRYEDVEKRSRGQAEVWEAGYWRERDGKLLLTITHAHFIKPGLEELPEPRSKALEVTPNLARDEVLLSLMNLAFAREYRIEASPDCAGWKLHDAHVGCSRFPATPVLIPASFAPVGREFFRVVWGSRVLVW